MSEYQEKAKQCICCTKHVPLPTTLKIYNEFILCPTTYYNVVEYKRIWDSFGSRPAGSIRKHFSEYVQQIVESSIDTSK
jgi:predicted aldo/keto reductase-like oxidoreductase